jgi:hypothetical protein
MTELAHGFSNGSKIYIDASSDTGALPLGEYVVANVTADTYEITGVDTGASSGTSEYSRYSGTITAPSVNPRFDVVVKNSDNTLTVVIGAESATPILPPIASTQKALKIITLLTSTIAITDSIMIDARDQGCLYQKDGQLKYEWKIQDAIDDLSSGGNIEIGRGIYYENLTYDDSQVLTFKVGSELKTIAGVSVILGDVDLSGTTATKIVYDGGENHSDDNQIDGVTIFNDKFNMKHRILDTVPYGIDTTISGSNNIITTALSTNRIAFFDAGNDDLRTYDFNGSSYIQIGNSLNLGSLGAPSISSLSSTRISLVFANGIRTYDFDGTDWAQVGNTLAQSFTGIIANTALTSSRIAMIDSANKEIRTYDFDGTDWAQVGNGLSIAGFSLDSAMTAMKNNRISYIDDGNQDLRTYDFDGTDWVQVGNDLNISGSAAPTIVSIDENRIYSMMTNTLAVYKFDGTDWIIEGTPLSVAATAPKLSALSFNKIVYSTGTTIKTYYANLDMLTSEIPSPAF